MKAGILRRSMHRKRGVPDSPRIVADAKETACTRVISSPYRITESAEILSRLNPLPNPALLGFQSVEIQASGAAPPFIKTALLWLKSLLLNCGLVLRLARYARVVFSVGAIVTA